MSAPPPLAVSIPVTYQATGSGQYNREFKGEGTLTIAGEPATFEFTGKIRAAFSRQARVRTLTADEIFNVTLAGRRVQFSVGRDATAGGAPFVFYCRTEAEAQSVAERLPRRIDEEFVARRAFQTRLAELAAERHPYFTVTNAIIALNVGVFLVMAGWLGAGWFDVTDLTPYYLYGANNAAATTNGEWWRLLTSMFLHYGLLHLGLNMWALFDAGHLLERLQGRALYAVTYLAAGLGGGMLTLCWHGDKVWSAGASGAVFGVFGALLGYILRERRSLPRTVFQPMVKSTLVFAGYNLFYGAVHPGIDNAAHIGGLLSGLLLGWLTARPLEPGRRARGQGARLAVAGAALVAIVALGYARAPRFDYFFPDELAWNRAYQGYDEKEQALLQRENNERRRYTANSDNLDAWVRLIETEIIPYYREVASRGAALTLKPGLRTAQRRAALSRFAELRIQAYEHLARGLRTDDAQEFTRYKELDRQATLAIEAADKP